MTMSVMATANYNEVYNAVTLSDGRLGGDPSQMDPMFHWDTHFPERLSRLTISPDFTSPCSGSPASSRARSARNRRNRNAARFKTQPITFDEIKEVDEDTSANAKVAAIAKEDSYKENLKNQFTTFSRSMDGLVVSPFSKKDAKSSPLSSSQASSSEEDRSTASIQRQKFRQRRKKRHTKSIEEAPELDRIDTTDGTG